MGILKKSRVDEIRVLERKLRYAVIALLDAYGIDDVGVVEDIVSEAHYDWSIVNE